MGYTLLRGKERKKEMELCTVDAASYVISSSRWVKNCRMENVNIRNGRGEERKKYLW